MLCFTNLVLKLYGNGQEDQIIFLAPATQMKPVFIERIDGENLPQLICNSVNPVPIIIMNDCRTDKKSISTGRFFNTCN